MLTLNTRTRRQVDHSATAASMKSHRSGPTQARVARLGPRCTSFTLRVSWASSLKYVVDQREPQKRENKMRLAMQWNTFSIDPKEERERLALETSSVGATRSSKAVSSKVQPLPSLQHLTVVLARHEVCVQTTPAFQLPLLFFSKKNQEAEMHAHEVFPSILAQKLVSMNRKSTDHLVTPASDDKKDLSQH